MDVCEIESCQQVGRQAVQAAIQAPTPDNNQPWKYIATGNRLEIYLDPKRALASDVNSMFDLIGIGAAVENGVIAGRQMGHCSEVISTDALRGQFSSEGDRLIATIEFQGESKPDPLHEQISTRCTNRNLYRTERVSSTKLEKLAQEAQEFPQVQIDWVDDRSRIGQFAKLIAASDRLRFEYQPFHQELFEQLRFTVKEAEATRDGLDVRTLELPPGVASVIHWLRYWSRMQRINRLGLGPMLTFPSWLSVRKSGALGVLSLPEASADQFLQGGRAFQRIWLAASAAGLALQPLGSLPIFIGQLQQLEGKNLHARHQKLASQLQAKLEQLVPATVERTLLMVFRLGHAKPPKVRSLRRPKQDVLEQLDND
jgi:nitroreductase